MWLTHFIELWWLLALLPHMGLWKKWSRNKTCLKLNINTLYLGVWWVGVFWVFLERNYLETGRLNSRAITGTYIIRKWLKHSD